MSYGGKGVRTEHAGAKNGRGYWGIRIAAKTACRVMRRAADATTDWAVSYGNAGWYDYRAEREALADLLECDAGLCDCQGACHD